MDHFKKKLKRRNIDAAMIRVQSTYTYFVGTKWLRPALLVPAEGDPVLFAARGEEEELANRTWINNIVMFTDGGDLMAKVFRYH
ncbi:MAG: aminopeptidase P family N-terminal domain-containing protein [Staphylothermus sp.]|nr:aminopeptidase P family N-terminal domain-containing protein [Staphylothermus sp.]